MREYGANMNGLDKVCSMLWFGQPSTPHTRALAGNDKVNTTVGRTLWAVASACQWRMGATSGGGGGVQDATLL